MRALSTLDPRDFQMPASRALMAEAKRRLDSGCGLVVLDRYPVHEYTKDELKAIYWLLSRMIGSIVPQSPDGTLLHDVRDTGRKMSERVRGDLTSQELNWHTDNGFSMPPKYFGLAVLRIAKEGGDSRAVNLVEAHERLAAGAPKLLNRLHQPYIWRRIGDYGTGDDAVAEFPVYGEDDGDFVCRINRRVIEAGYRSAGQPLDSEGRDALEALYTIFDEPGVALAYRLEPGQMQWMNNFALAHHRTTYVDWHEEERKRHLVRIYISAQGGHA
jgi:alpha-ketoglutarate-dependent taurine dioxygenase